MMRLFIFILFTFFGCLSFSSEQVAIKEVVKKVTKKQKVKKKAGISNSSAPCDSKEDVLKKLEEKKKAESASGKAFSLQGASTGCSVK